MRFAFLSSLRYSCRMLWMDILFGISDRPRRQQAPYEYIPPGISDAISSTYYLIHFELYNSHTSSAFALDKTLRKRMKERMVCTLNLKFTHVLNTYSHLTVTTWFVRHTVKLTELVPADSQLKRVEDDIYFIENLLLSEHYEYTQHKNEEK